MLGTCRRALKYGRLRRDNKGNTMNANRVAVLVAFLCTGFTLAAQPAAAGNFPEEKPRKAIPAEVANRNLKECVFPVANIALDRKTMDKVIHACTILIEAEGGSDKNRSDVYLQRGSMYRRLGKFDLALADFNLSIRYSPASADAYTGRGNSYRGLHKLDESIADHSEAIRLDPKNSTAYNNRGNALSDKKEFTRAIADYDEAIKLYPNYASAYYNRGLARKDTNDKDGAIADFRQALKINPNMPQPAAWLKELGAKP
jgi:tetratricopeptide (TPR) repeat protein